MYTNQTLARPGYIALWLLAVLWLLVVFQATVAQAVVFKIATLAPEGSGWMQKIRAGAQEIREQTDGRVKFKFYPGGVMGDDKAVLRKIRIGQLQGGALIAGSLAQFFPDSQVYNLPFIFKSFDEVDYVRQRMDSLLVDGLEAAGMVTFGLAEGGFAYAMSKVPIRSLEDLRKQKVWIPDNDAISLETVRTFDVNPIPLSLADVRTGLQTGLVDTVTTSAIGALALQWHTQVKYVSDVPFIYIIGMMAIARDAFMTLTSGDQKIVRAVMGDVFKDIDRQNRVDNVNAHQALLNQGLEFVQPSSEGMADWKATADKVAQRLVDAQLLSADVVAALQDHLSRFRSQQSQQNE